MLKKGRPDSVNIHFTDIWYKLKIEGEILFIHNWYESIMVSPFFCASIVTSNSSIS